MGIVIDLVEKSYKNNLKNTKICHIKIIL